MNAETPPRAPAVLVVDGDEESATLAARVLQEEGFRVLVAREGRDALAYLDREELRLVVADPDAPGLDLDSLGEARSRPGAPALLLVTSRLSLDLVALRRRLRAADVLQKPIEPGELAACARVLVRPRVGELGSFEGGAAPIASRAWSAVGSAVGSELRAVIPDILFSIPAWLLVADSDLVVRFANGSLLDYLGRSFTEVSGLPVEEVLASRLAQGKEALATMRNAVTEAEPRSLPALLLSDPSGEDRAVDLQATPVDLAGGRYVLVILHDVSEHLRARDAIQRENRKLEEIMNGMGASLAVLDRDLRVRWSNRTFERWFGEMWGRRFHHALRGLLLGGDLDPERIFTEGEYASKEWAHIDGKGDRRYYRNLIIPVHNVDGRLEELVLVTQDLTEVTHRSEQHLLLRELANLLQTTLEMDHLLYIILTCLTAGHALGFNRAFLFLTDEAETTIRGRMGVGPSSREEAFAIWADLASSRQTLADLTTDFEDFLRREPGPLTALITDLEIPLTGPGADSEILARAAIEKRSQVVKDAGSDPRVTEEFLARFSAREFACTPLTSKGEVVGVVLVDNVFSERGISEEQAEALELFSATAGLAVDNARTYAELRRSLERLETAQEAAIHAERLATVGRLAAHVAHEIRNPLVTIGGFAAAIRRRPEDEAAVSRGADIIYEEVLRLEEILSGVMDFTRPKPHHPERKNVNDLVRRLVETLRPETSEKEVALETDLGDVPDSLLDEKRIHQALLNLVKNAIESVAEVPAGSRPRRVGIRTEAMPGRIRIEVSDNGQGVPEDLLPDLFEPFISRKSGGTGLGLAVVRKVANDHGGAVSVSNRPGEGATFVLELPVERPDS